MNGKRIGFCSSPITLPTPTAPLTLEEARYLRVQGAYRGMLAEINHRQELLWDDAVQARLAVAHNALVDARRTIFGKGSL